MSIYGDPNASEDITGLRESIHEHGILVPLVLTPCRQRGVWEILSGHRRWACALSLDLPQVPCHLRPVESEAAAQQAVLQYNRQRRKTFSQLMKEADVLEVFLGDASRKRRLANLRQQASDQEREALPMAGVERRKSDNRMAFPALSASAEMTRKQGRTDSAIARELGLGAKDQYRQARAIWRLAQQGDVRAEAAVAQLDAGTKTTNAAYKDLRRRDRFAVSFRPTPYDVWRFRHDRAFGLTHPGSIPPAIVAHALHYLTAPGDLVVDPMAGGGTTLDVCVSMGRRCLAYDIEPVRPEIAEHDVRTGFPEAAKGCKLIFCDPPYHTMLASQYLPESVASVSLHAWITFLHELTQSAFQTLDLGGYFALLLAPQTEKDLPAGHGYVDHVFYGYIAALRAGFHPERRVSCPMDGAYLPQQVQRARIEGRMLGQVRDLLIMRKASGLTPALNSYFAFPEARPI
jgi:ParB-like chromosome segregation protein Spo0J